MAPRSPSLPNHVERSLLQQIRANQSIRLDFPYSKPTLARLAAKGWIEEILSKGGQPNYRITEVGEEAFKAKLPTER